MKLIELEKERKNILKKRLITRFYLFFITFCIVGATYVTFVSSVMFFYL